MILLDTNVVSALRHPDRMPPNVARWAASIPLADFYLSVITVMEIEVGVLQMERRDDRQGRLLRAWFTDQVLARFDGRILPLDLSVARLCALLHVPDKRPDAMIAATALSRGIPVATRNTADFAPTGVALINPWEAA